MDESRKRRLVEENEEEDRYINKLKKRLKLNKKSIIPASFRTDGLDYVLEVCESNDKSKKENPKQNLKKRSLANLVKNLKDEESDEDFGSFDEDDEGDGDGISNEKEDGDEDQDTNEEEDNDESSKKESKKPKANEKDDIWEDVYGRLRSKDGGIIEEKLEISSNSKYVPPQLRGDSVVRQKIMKNMKGLLNRLSENNMHSIAQDVEKLYLSNSRNEMNEALFELFSISLLRPSLMPERLLLEHIMLIAILHANIGTEIGAFFIQSFVKKFRTTYDSIVSVDEDETKEIYNLMLLICYMYHYKVVNAGLIFDMLKLFSNNFSSKDIELILTILRSVGFRLRKDSPTELKDLILLLQRKAGENKGETNSRTKFMLEILLAIRNNNMTKIPNYDPSVGDHFNKILKAFLRKGNYISELKITMEDLLNAETKGKWWIVGSAWKGIDSEAGVEKTEQVVASNFSQSQELLAKAKSQGMNTPARQNIFCILMSSEDFMDAFNKLGHLGLKNHQEREIIHVIVYCCLQEKCYNPFYFYLCQQFTKTARHHMLTLQYTLWDRLKDLKNQSSVQKKNLSKFLIHLIKEKVLPISSLKVIEFGDMEKGKMNFLKSTLNGILLGLKEEDITEIFTKCALPEKLKMFRESLRLFMNHFLLLKDQNKAGNEKTLIQLKEKVQIADQAMSLGHGIIKL